MSEAQKLRNIAKLRISRAEMLREAYRHGYSDGYQSGHDHQMDMRVRDVQEQRERCKARKCSVMAALARAAKMEADNGIQ